MHKSTQIQTCEFQERGGGCSRKPLGPTCRGLKPLCGFRGTHLTKETRSPEIPTSLQQPGSLCGQPHISKTTYWLVSKNRDPQRVKDSTQGARKRRRKSHQKLGLTTGAVTWAIFHQGVFWGMEDSCPLVLEAGENLVTPNKWMTDTKCHLCSPRPALGGWGVG